MVHAPRKAQDGLNFVNRARGGFAKRNRSTGPVRNLKLFLWLPTVFTRRLVRRFCSLVALHHFPDSLELLSQSMSHTAPGPNLGYYVSGTGTGVSPPP